MSRCALPSPSRAARASATGCTWRPHPTSSSLRTCSRTSGGRAVGYAFKICGLDSEHTAWGGRASTTRQVQHCPAQGVLLLGLRCPHKWPICHQKAIQPKNACMRAQQCTPSGTACAVCMVRGPLRVHCAGCPLSCAAPRFQHNRFVKGPPFLRFYAGAPLASLAQALCMQPQAAPLVG